MKYRKKPVTVDAWDIDTLLSTVTITGVSGLDGCLQQAWDEGLLEFEYGPLGDHVKVITMEGVMIGKPGDKLIRGVQGEFYPCDGEIFSKTYEEESNQ